jgi:hypothetical protein
LNRVGVGIKPSSPTNGKRSGVLPSDVLILHSAPFAAKMNSRSEIHCGEYALSRIGVTARG